MEFDGDEFVVSEEVKIALSEYWDKIFYEYLDALNEYGTKEKYLAVLDLRELEFDYKVISNALTLYQADLIKDDRIKIEKIFRSKGLIVDHTKDLAPQLEKVEGHLKALLTNILQKRQDNEKIFKDDEIKVKASIYKDVVILEEILKKDIDPMTCTCPKWIEYWKRVKEKNIKQTA
jgi:hypothetical protein